jgi:hypothetical protein
MRGGGGGFAGYGERCCTSLLSWGKRVILADLNLRGLIEF